MQHANLRSPRPELSDPAIVLIIITSRRKNNQYMTPSLDDRILTLSLAVNHIASISFSSLQMNCYRVQWRIFALKYNDILNYDDDY